MSYAPFSLKEPVLGSFVEKSNGHLFEFSEPKTETPVWGDFPVKLWVTPPGSTAQFRWAKILKTVAYVVVNEADDGSPVTEKWSIKKLRNYL